VEQLAGRAATESGSARRPNHEPGLSSPNPPRVRTADDGSNGQPSEDALSVRWAAGGLEQASGQSSVPEEWSSQDSVTFGDRSGENRTVLAQSAYILRKRLIWVILAVFLACGVATGAYLGVPPTQESSAAVLFVPSIKVPGVTGPTNPLLSLGNASAIVASVVQITVSDDETMQKLAAAGFTAKYEVVQDTSQNSGPVLLITVQDTSPQMAQGTRDAVVAEIGTQLKALQDDGSVAADLRVTTVSLTSSREPKLVHKTQIRLAVLAGLGTLGAALAVILLLERRSARRRSGPMYTDAPATLHDSEDIPFEPGVNRPKNTSADLTDPPY